jgi:hypothetical protein
MVSVWTVPTTTTNKTQPHRQGDRSARRRHRRRLLLFGLPGLLVGVIAALVRHQPDFYVERLSAGDQAEQTRLSREFLAAISNLRSDILYNETWECDFTEPQINAFLADKFDVEHAWATLPGEISEPRVAMYGDRMVIGFRYRKGLLSTVVQFAIRAWVPKSNALIVELQGAWVGRLPLPTTYTQQVIERLASAYNLSAQWYRNGHRLAAVLEFPRGSHDYVLQQVEIRDAAIRIKGVTSRVLYSEAPKGSVPAAN